MASIYPLWVALLKYSPLLLDYPRQIIKYISQDARMNACLPLPWCVLEGAADTGLEREGKHGGSGKILPVQYGERLPDQHIPLSYLSQKIQKMRQNRLMQRVSTHNLRNYFRNPISFSFRKLTSNANLHSLHSSHSFPRLLENLYILKNILQENLEKTAIHHSVSEFPLITCHRISMHFNGVFFTSFS